MSNERKRKQDDLTAATQSAESATKTTTSLFGGDSTTGSSLTASLFGESSASTPQSDLFSSTDRFQDAFISRIDKNAKKSSQHHAVKSSGPSSDSTTLPSSSSRESILLQRKQQAASSFLNEITSLAPYPANDDDHDSLAVEGKEKNDGGGVFSVPPNVMVDEIADVVRMHGFAVVKNVLSKQLLENLSVRANEIEKQVCARLDQRDIEWRCNNAPQDPQTFRFYEVASRCKGRMDVRYGTDQEPFSVSEIVSNKSLQPIVDSLLGGGAAVMDASHQPELLYAGLIFSFSGSNDQPWHQDGMPLFPELSPSQAMLPPYAINIFLPLTDADASMEAGPTEFIPASHIMEESVVLDCVEQAKKEIYGDQVFVQTNGGASDKKDEDDETDAPIVGPLLQQGDALIYDYRVCHRGTANLAKSGRTRRILYLMYARPWFKEHLNFASERLFHPDEEKQQNGT